MVAGSVGTDGDLLHSRAEHERRLSKTLGSGAGRQADFRGCDLCPRSETDSAGHKSFAHGTLSECRSLADMPDARPAHP